MKKQSVLLLLLMFLFIWPQVSSASQVSSSPTRGFHGSIIDVEGRRLPDVSVVVENKEQQWWRIKADEAGEFRIELAPGAYRFSFEREGWKTFTFTDFVIRETRSSYEFKLEPGVFPGDLKLIDGIQLLTTETVSQVLLNRSWLPEPQSAPNIGVNGKLAADKVKRGGTVRGTVTMDIPSGYHVNSSRPLEKFLVATQLTIGAPNGIRVGPVTYPRALLRNFQFSKTKVSVYEGRAVMSFNVSVPAKASTGKVELKGRLRYQSCNDSLCFPPKTQEVSFWLSVN